MVTVRFILSDDEAVGQARAAGMRLPSFRHGFGSGIRVKKKHGGALLTGSNILCYTTCTVAALPKPR